MNNKYDFDNFEPTEPIGKDLEMTASVSEEMKIAEPVADSTEFVVPTAEKIKFSQPKEVETQTQFNREVPEQSFFNPYQKTEPTPESFGNPYGYKAPVRVAPYAPVVSKAEKTAEVSYAPSDFGSVKKKSKSGKKALGFVAAVCAVLVAAGGSFYGGVAYNAKSVEQALDASGSSGSAVAAIGSVQPSSVVSNNESTSGNSNAITQVVENVMPSMVAVNTTIETQMSGYGYFFGGGGSRTYETSACGSGIIINQDDDELFIVTNNHVIEDAKQISVDFVDGSSCDAAIKGTSADNDLAVISVKLADMSADTLSEIKIAQLGDSDSLMLGETAIAIGNSLGYGQSVTVGYISAKEREVQLTDGTMTLLQTDAAINPGNSGGALLNIKGEVIGINSAKYSDTSVEGTGYAIPITDAIPIINNLISAAYVPEEEKPYLGIYGQDVPVSYQTRFNWPAGVYVSEVSNGSPASLAGLRSGDIITAINDTEITTMEELQGLIEKCSVGDVVEIQVTRSSNGEVTSGKLTATLIARGDAE